MLIEQNVLYKKHVSRYLTRKGAKPVTICIVAICDMFSDVSPKIILCADRAVSTNIQFEGGESKIKHITDWCYILQSSNNSFVSDLILERVKAKVQTEKCQNTLRITEILKDECITYKTECVQRDVLETYQTIGSKLNAPPESYVKLAKDDVTKYLTNNFDFVSEFIVAGLEPNEAHIYLVNQNGEYYLGDSLGYLTIGSGSDLAFLQMTRYIYSMRTPMTPAMTLVYIAKKISERAIGVGRTTDFLILHSPDTKNFTPMLFDVTQNKKCIKKLDATFVSIDKRERNMINRTFTEILCILNEERKK
jgi:hypothetical protein